MLLSPRQDTFCTFNNNAINHPHYLPPGQNMDRNSLAYQISGQLLTNASKCYSPRPVQKSKIPPHITICPPDSAEGHSGSAYLDDDELDNDVFRASGTTSPTHSSSAGSDEKHEVHSGRLYLVRHTGSTSSPSSPSMSPSRSPSKSGPISFPFRSSSSPPTSCNSPNSSPSRKTPVFVRVYRCNNDHFAIVSRDCLYTSKPVYINMRHCRVIPGDCLGRFIVAGKCDSGTVIEFETLDLSSLEQWLDAFQTLTPPASPNRSAGGGSAGSVGSSTNSPSIPRSPALPTLNETDEED
ncbi:hypothetical protein BgiMline_021606 [Biomphalaria glabrata]|uniref:Uncharacterized protein LOC106067049 n=1 Tax=Biomphalaria glabrata TaxID=6526 RepID=A0A9U8EC71_BIOGL|nr:uncharacterized protein LOC106067049 [Biomphalaria glabrata]KAI8733972.1 AT-rich interactive domain-containing protein 1B [Biomphalaria glabrata]KAI8761558.1 AT-rich interactive domain-containing protein 1B [Biomphalaria glabrata]